MDRRVAGLIFAVSASVWPLAQACADDDVSDFAIDLKGYIQGRVIIGDDTQTWQRGGLGKTLYGGLGNSVLPRADGALAIEPHFGFDFSAHVVVVAGADQTTPVDITEAYLQYRPAPVSAIGFRARAGMFFPPISLENTDLGWTSPYTVTPSAINSWVGEELRTIGGEATVFHRTQTFEIAATGAVFTDNDPTGTQLAWRGWSFDDHVAGLFDRLALPPLPILKPGGILSKQAPTEEPFREIDNRAGTYTQVSLSQVDYGRISALWYNNNANDHTFDGGQWAWHTHFWSVGYDTELPADIKLLAQYMSGSTSVVSLPEPIGALDYTDFWSAYALISKEWGRHQLSFRADRFETYKDDIGFDDTKEHGYALTFAYVFHPALNQRLTLEFLHINSFREARAYYFGLPPRAIENQVQASYRLFFNIGP